MGTNNLIIFLILSGLYLYELVYVYQILTKGL